MGCSSWGHKELDTTERPTLTAPPTYSSMFPVQVDECKVLGVVRDGGRSFLKAQLAKNLPAMQETPVEFLGWEDLLEKG